MEARIKELIDGCAAVPFTVEISDPLALSFIAELPHGPAGRALSPSLPLSLFLSLSLLSLSHSLSHTHSHTHSLTH